MPNNEALSGIVTFLTDFGLEDGYVGAMKGALLTHAPHAKIVDITHEISPFDIRSAFLVLEANFSSFPKGTVHVAIVDPEVGSARRHLLAMVRGHVFIGPDNGIPGAVAKAHQGKVYEIVLEQLGVKPPSSTFHGRDVYAVAAGRLLKDNDASSFIRPLDNPVVIDLPQPVRVACGFEGEIIHIDHFGNLITNLRPEHVPGDYVFIVNERNLERVSSYFELPRKALGVVLDSWGYYEVCANQDRASELSGLGVGSKIAVVKK